MNAGRSGRPALSIKTKIMRIIFQFLKLVRIVIITSFFLWSELLAQDQEATLFMADVVSTHYPERDFTLSPDGKTAFFTVQTYQYEKQAIVQMNKEGQSWTQPEVAFFSGTYKDLEPSYTPDGTRLYFSSNRPVGGNDEKTDFDLWYVNLGTGASSDPVHLGNVVNTNTNEFYPSVVEDGSLYFTASYEDSKGSEDIYYSQWNGKAFEQPVSLDTMINSRVYEFNAYVSPDESFIIFSSYGRQDDLGGGDLYISHKNTDGTWMQARNMGEIVNSTALDFCPFVSPDGQYFYFTSNRSNYEELTAPLNLVQLKNSMIQIFNGHGNIFRIPVKSLITFGAN